MPADKGINATSWHRRWRDKENKGLLLSYCFLAAHTQVRGKTDPSDTVREEGKLGKQLWEYVI